MSKEIETDSVSYLQSAKIDLASIILKSINKQLLKDNEVCKLLDINHNQYVNLRCGALEDFDLWDLFRYICDLGLDVYISIYSPLLSKSCGIFVKDMTNDEDLNDIENEVIFSEDLRTTLARDSDEY